MKTMKTILIILVLAISSANIFATGVKVYSNEDVRHEVRDQIARAIQSANIQGAGEVTLRFGINRDHELQVLSIDTQDPQIAGSIKDALCNARLQFPETSQGVYQIKVYVNQTAEPFNYDVVRNQVAGAVDPIKPGTSNTVQLRLRIIDASTVQVLKANSADPKLAELVKNSIESKQYLFPRKLYGEYQLKVSFE